MTERIHTHYDNLFVTRNAPVEVIRAAYRALAQKYHPDKSKSPDSERIMKLVNEAWAILSEPTLKREHDQNLSSREGAATSCSRETARPERSDKSKRESTASYEPKSETEQQSLLTQLTPLAEKLWFKNFSQDYVSDYLQSRGVTKRHAETLVRGLFSKT